MNKSDLKILEQAFDLETRGAMFQRKSKQITRLADAGYLEAYSFRDGQGWLRMTVSGYRLTEKGRMAYCETCKIQ